jgi:hypothetical protein
MTACHCYDDLVLPACHCHVSRVRLAPGTILLARAGVFIGEQIPVVKETTICKEIVTQEATGRTLVVESDANLCYPSNEIHPKDVRFPARCVSHSPDPPPDGVPPGLANPRTSPICSTAGTFLPNQSPNPPITTSDTPPIVPEPRTVSLNPSKILPVFLSHAHKNECARILPL